MSSLRNFNTDLLRERAELRALLAELCVPNEHGCLLFPRAAIEVRLQGYTSRCHVSPARVAWALHNDRDVLTIHDLAVHICVFGWEDIGRWDGRVCCNPHHIKKGTAHDVALMNQVRARGLILSSHNGGSN